MAGTVLHCSCKAGVERKAQGSLRERVGEVFPAGRSLEKGTKANKGSTVWS